MDFDRKHLADKQRGLCASCRLELPTDFCVRRERYGPINVSYAQYPPCFRENRPRADGYTPGTLIDAFFKQFSRRPSPGPNLGLEDRSLRRLEKIGK